MFKLEPTENFSTLTSMLQFEETFEPAASLIFQHVRQTHDRLTVFLQSDPLISPALGQAIGELPKESILRLATSPYLDELLTLSQEKKEDPDQALPLRQQIVKALVAEVRRSQSSFEHPSETPWTLDGDFVLDPNLSAAFPAIETECGIRLNYQSYIHNTGKPGIGGYSYEMGLKHKERIETAKGIIALVSESALSLVDHFTTTIQFRMNRARPNIVNSSTHTSIGLIRCDNFHQLHADMPEIVDMLVHESIHQYLHLFEEQIMPFVNLQLMPPELSENRIFASPWSGNKLDLRSYTHAILVWYGLWHFWSAVKKSGFTHSEISNLQIDAKIREAAFGFSHSQSVFDHLGEASSYLTRQYRDQIHLIQREIGRDVLNTDASQSRTEVACG